MILQERKFRLGEKNNANCLCCRQLYTSAASNKSKTLVPEVYFHCIALHSYNISILIPFKFDDIARNRIEIRWEKWR